MSDRNEWKNWMSPILERRIARGETEEQCLKGILPTMRDQVSELYRQIKAERAKAVGA
ncbi:MAG TPA: hypothetical protein VH022_14310 [Candidatus Acidoferrum sp.]|jgi:hypothetical protein|nr:hypothetical protein [Candidatus Acidoferrum sp.]